MEETIEITYSVLGYDEVGETTFEMNVSESMYEKLQDIECEGEILDSEYLSEEKIGIHNKIIRAIRKNIEEETLFNPDDGVVEKRRPWGARYQEFDYNASHENLEVCDDDEIQYTISLY